MNPSSVRFEQQWTFSQLAKIRQFRPELVDEMVAEVLTRQAELRWLVVVGAYIDGEINLGKAAELLGMHRLDLQAQFMTQGIPLRSGAETLEDAVAEVAAISEWNLTKEGKHANGRIPKSFG